MRYTIYFLLLVVVTAACSNQTKDEESIRSQISEYKQQIGELNKKIAGLENDLKDLSGTAESAYSVPIQVDTLSYQTFEHYFDVSGTVEAVREAFVSPEISGQIKNIYVGEGEYVRQGQLLIKLNTEITENNINEVRSSLNHATTVYEKQKRLWEKGIGSEVQYLNAENNKDALENRLETLKSQQAMAMIKSPVNGVVDEIYLKEGEIAMPGTRLMMVVNLKELYINADVSESYLSSVKAGDMAQVSFPVYPELTINVPVYRTGNFINPNNRTFIIQLKIKNTDDKLKPNVLAIIKIRDFSSDQALTVPTKVIKQDIKGHYLYKLTNDDNIMQAAKVYIKTGLTSGEYTMVLEGLNPGDKIIVKGYTQVSDGTKVMLNSVNNAG